MDEIDKLLAKLDQSKPQALPVDSSKVASDRSSTANYASIDDLLQSLGTLAKQQVQSRLSAAVPSPSPIVPEIQEYQEAQVTQEQAQQQQYDQRKAALLQQRRQELEQQAQIWLQKLDHRSDEGRWFDEFACHYESKLVAAIEYFLALQDINSPLP
jgi:multidrug efflux pump subunit AcrA (membrane-fusion protein)